MHRPPFTEYLQWNLLTHVSTGDKIAEAKSLPGPKLKSAVVRYGYAIDLHQDVTRLKQGRRRRHRLNSLNQYTLDAFQSHQLRPDACTPSSSPTHRSRKETNLVLRQHAQPLPHGSVL
eukprot:scaffold179_cov368-Prasinococcus_capsulatus_cf.AAC.34